MTADVQIWVARDPYGRPVDTAPFTAADADPRRHPLARTGPRDTDGKTWELSTVRAWQAEMSSDYGWEFD